MWKSPQSGVQDAHRLVESNVEKWHVAVDNGAFYPHEFTAWKAPGLSTRVCTPCPHVMHRVLHSHGAQIKKARLGKHFSDLATALFGPRTAGRRHDRRRPAVSRRHAAGTSRRGGLVVEKGSAAVDNIFAPGKSHPRIGSRARATIDVGSVDEGTRRRHARMRWARARTSRVRSGRLARRRPLSRDPDRLRDDPGSS